jgi:thiol-disulfide isomerase/thioredoxin
MTRKWILAAAAVLALLVATSPIWWEQRPGAATSEAARAIPAGVCDAQARPAPLDQTIKDMNGQDVSLASYKGKVVFVNFWATWCGPCKIEIPHFVELQDKYRDKGVVFLGLSVDDSVEQLEPFVEQYKINYPILIGLGRDDVQEAFGPLWGIPVTFIIDRQGNICRKHEGLATSEQFERVIQALL